MPHTLDKTFEVHLQVAENRCPVAGGRMTVVNLHHHILKHDWLERGEVTRWVHIMVSILNVSRLI